MEIRSESRINHPREKVYKAYRDRLPEIVVYIPDIKQIVVKSRTDEGLKTTLHNEWISDRDVPTFAQAFLKPEYLRWDDFASWDESNWSCDWRIKTRAFTEAVSCGGRNTFLEDGPNATRVVLSGDLSINLKEIRGIPSFLAGRVGPQVEKFIISLITPNLEQVNKSLGRFLDEKG